MASVEPYDTKGGKRYMVRWRDPAHKLCKKKGFKTKREAEQFKATIVSDLSDGAYVAPSSGKVTVGSLAPTWLAGKRARLKESSYHSLETSWRVHVEPRWADRAIGSIRKSEIQLWASELSETKSPTIVQRAVSEVLKAILDMAVSDRLLKANPCNGVELPRKKSEPHKYLSERELLEVADASGAYRPLVLLLGFCGPRWGEATGLRVRNVDFSANRIHIEVSATKVGSKIVEGTPKSNKARDVSMPRIVADALREQCEGKGPDDLVFTAADGGYVRQQSTAEGNRGFFKRALVACGLPMMRVHDLRHTAASIMVHAGANVKAVQRQLGHSSASMTLDTYADLFDDDLDNLAASIDRIVGHANAVA